MEKSSQIIKAKALRKKGTADIWYRYIPNQDDPFDEMPLPDPWENDLDTEGLNYAIDGIPDDAELVDIEIKIIDPMVGIMKKQSPWIVYPENIPEIGQWYWVTYRDGQVIDELLTPISLKYWPNHVIAFMPKHQKPSPYNPEQP